MNLYVAVDLEEKLILFLEAKRYVVEVRLFLWDLNCKLSADCSRRLGILQDREILYFGFFCT